MKNCPYCNYSNYDYARVCRKCDGAFVADQRHRIRRPHEKVGSEEG